MKKIIFLILSFSFIFATEIICKQKVKTVGFENSYYKICVNNHEYIALDYGYRSGIMGATNIKCKCIPYKEKIFFKYYKKYKLKEIYERNIKKH